MRHRWGLPDKDGHPDDSVLVRTPQCDERCFCGLMYCLRCETVFCESCLGPQMFNLDNCPGEATRACARNPKFLCRDETCSCDWA